MKKELNKILSYTTYDPATGCMNWTRCLNTDGYPRAVVNTNNNIKVHRLVYELTHTEDISKLVIRHSCDNIRCINPEHLKSGTTADNMKDRDSKERHGASKLSHADVRKIRYLYSTGKYKQKDIGLIFGVNARTISSIINLSHFKHVV